MAITYSKWALNISAFSILIPSKSYPSLAFWFENIPSGNPGRERYFDRRRDIVARWFILHNTKNPNLGTFWRALE
jgi:hypothetical protein